MKKNLRINLLKMICYLWFFILPLGIPPFHGYAAKPAAALAILSPQQTINISEPVSSADQLVDILSDSLNRVCENLNLTIKNTNQWFSKEIFAQCMNRVDTKSLMVGLYYKGYNYNYTYNTANKSALKMNIHFNYLFPRKTLLQYLKAIETKAVNIINTVITPDMDDYQKEKALHDYIINHARYDELNFRNNTVPAESYTPYGILIKGAGVCAGYAYTMKYLCDKAGIDCIVVSGKAEGGDHAWNIVKIGGEYYHVDLTWDDPAGKDLLRYYYFNLNDEMMAVNHRWDNKLYPKCIATEYNYYQKNNLWVADMEECRERIENTIAAREEKVHMQVSGFSLPVFKKNLQTVVAEQRFYGKYSYSYDEELGIVEIKFEYSD